MTGELIYEERLLLARIAEGDKDAFRRLFHRYNPTLWPFILKLTGSPSAVEDVLQEVFLKIWIHRDKLTAVENPKAYIVRIVSNESANYLRQMAREKRLFAPGLPGAAPLADEPSAPLVDEALALRETESLLRDAVSRLPEACRQVYQMSREDDLRIPEIASELHLSPHTVKNQLSKALRVLRGQLGPAAMGLLIFFNRP
ncbi:RNA polymerase sigma factor [Dinghuibacter silviterrae]|uniref:RNA polymerase sigma factor n=1 Tax=Dinghuibacter silviterrae TaxID=1539049 RepID=A0A4R8DH69_9BACT|nr:RNA polymerase sigma-70 factor [Dinghuibacter silviterrae]TDW97051.1 RNA polymerase sigma-70 factor (ECF subfamily) [Dinghuibacter silviterrae]